MGATHFSGPVIVGDLQDGQSGGPNKGGVQLTQYILIPSVVSASGTKNTDYTLYVPDGSIIMGFEIALLTSWDAATSANMVIGKTPAGNEYVTACDLKAAAPFPLMTQTAANIAAQRGFTVAGVLAPIPANINIRVATVGATTVAGKALVSVHYIQLY